MNQTLTFEQLNTLFIEIKSILSSRPICSLSSGPNDPQALTPEHLLIGRSLKALPEQDLLTVPDNRLCAWRFLLKARQDFWSRWYQDYLNQLQTRCKWHYGDVKLTKGMILLLIEKKSPYLYWLKAIIEKVNPGEDGMV